MEARLGMGWGGCIMWEVYCGTWAATDVMSSNVDKEKVLRERRHQPKEPKTHIKSPCRGTYSFYPFKHDSMLVEGKVRGGGGCSLVLHITQ